jgi:hypothetical protein
MTDEYPVCPVCGSNSGQGCTADCTAAEITKLRAEVFWLRQGMSAKLSDHMNGTPCAEIRWQHERETLQAEVERLKGNIESWRRIPGQVAETYEADITRLRAALEAIRSRRYQNRYTVRPENAFEAYHSLNVEMLAIFDECDAALQKETDR